MGRSWSFGDTAGFTELARGLGLEETCGVAVALGAVEPEALGLAEVPAPPDDEAQPETAKTVAIATVNIESERYDTVTPRIDERRIEYLSLSTIMAQRGFLDEPPLGYRGEARHDPIE